MPSPPLLIGLRPTSDPLARLAKHMGLRLDLQEQKKFRAIPFRANLFWTLVARMPGCARRFEQSVCFSYSRTKAPHAAGGVAWDRGHR